MDKIENNKLKEFQEFVDYKFKNENLLIQALTTISFGNEIGRPNYDILETLGDAVIKLIFSLKIYNENNSNPGELTQKKQLLENDEILSLIARNYFNLDTYIFKRKNENLEESTILADVLEALCGALYLDSGKNLNLVENKIIDRFYKDRDSIIRNSPIFSKNELLEFLQKKYHTTPNIIPEFENLGSDHKPQWIAKNPKIYNLPKGLNLPKDLKSIASKSKQKAEMDLYKKILHYLKKSNATTEIIK